MNDSEEIGEIKTFPLYPYLLQGWQALPNCKPISVGCPGDVRYMTFASPNHPYIYSEMGLNTKDDIKDGAVVRLQKKRSWS